MTLTEFRKIIYDWYSATIGLSVIHSQQKGTKPDLPYGMVHIISSQTLGNFDEVSSPEEISGDATVKGQREFLISLHVFGPGSYDYLNLARNSLNRQTDLDVLFSKCVSVRNKENIVNATAELDTGFEEHYVFDVTFGVAESFTDTVGVIEKVELNDEVCFPE